MAEVRDLKTAGRTFNKTAVRTVTAEPPPTRARTPTATDLPARPADDVALRLRYRRVWPTLVEGARYDFLLPPWNDELFIESATGPTLLHPRGDERRLLGVAICRLRARNTAVAIDIPLDGPALGEGWWPIETSGAVAYRWTNGRASLVLPDEMRRGAILELTVCGRAQPAPIRSTDRPGAPRPPTAR